MPTRCVAAACSNTHRDGVSLFTLSRDRCLREKWVKQVHRTRAQWNPTENSVLCSKHFEEDCFEPGTDIAAQFGIKLTRKLKPEAVPSIFVRKRPTATNSLTVETDGGFSTTRKRRRGALEKKERSRVSSNLYHALVVALITTNLLYYCNS